MRARLANVEFLSATGFGGYRGDVRIYAREARAHACNCVPHATKTQCYATKPSVYATRAAYQLQNFLYMGCNEDAKGDMKGGAKGDAIKT